MKKAIVTGASGFIGQALVKYLIESGYKPIAVDILPFPIEGLCESYKLDVAVPGALDFLLDESSTVFHLAARASVPLSVKNPSDDFRNTLYGLFEVLESARQFKAKILFPSTASIFDTSNSLPVSEKSFVKPSSPYAAAKVAGEAYCAAYFRCYDIDIRIARMFSVYGIGMNRFAIHDIIQNIRKNSTELEILGDGGQIRDYLYIDDVVRGLVCIATRGKAGEDYNLASGIPVNILDLAKKIAAHMNVPDIKIKVSGQSFPGDVPQWFADISKISKIGFSSTASLDTGLQRTIDWIIENDRQKS
jgi:nucleoside-diphosphate-sugar epimerase